MADVNLRVNFRLDTYYFPHCCRRDGFAIHLANQRNAQARAEAQQAKKVPKIGFVSGSGDANNPGPYVEAFRQGLRELGYVEGKNLLIENRYAEGRLDRMPALVNELLEQKVDVFVATNNVAIRAAKKATKTIPIVMLSSVDAVSAGYVDGLARPGGLA